MFRKLAWSRAGSVAHISPDGLKVTFRALVRDKKTGEWSLSDGGNHPIRANRDARYVHVEWSVSGSEVVLVDHCGRLSIHVMAYALNRFLPNTISQGTHHDDLSAVVGLHWLSVFAGVQRVSFDLFRLQCPV